MSERKNFYKNGFFLNKKKIKLGCPHFILQEKNHISMKIPHVDFLKSCLCMFAL